jgi:hypothetical protein
MISTQRLRLLLVLSVLAGHQLVSCSAKNVPLELKMDVFANDDCSGSSRGTGTFHGFEVAAPSRGDYQSESNAPCRSHWSYTNSDGETKSEPEDSDQEKSVKYWCSNGVLQGRDYFDSSCENPISDDAAKSHFKETMESDGATNVHVYETMEPADFGGGGGGGGTAKCEHVVRMTVSGRHLDMSMRYHHNCYEIDDTLVDGWADEESIPMGIGGLVGLCVLLAICGKINEQSSSSSSSSSMSAERLRTPPQRSMPRHVPMQQQNLLIDI